MKLMSFKEWKKENPDIRPTDDMCPVCDGTGGVDCECSECGDVHERECAACDGWCYINTEEKLSDAVLRALYEKQMDEDKRRLQRNGIEYEEAE